MSRTEAAPAYQRYVSDSIADAARLTLEELGALRLLEDVAWREHGIDADRPGELARLFRCSERKAAALWGAINRAWVQDEHGRYVLEWMESQRVKREAQRAINRENGARGGRPPKPNGFLPKTESVSGDDDSRNRMESPASASAFASVEMLAAGLLARESDGEIVGTATGDINAAAIQFTSAVNSGVTKAHGEQIHPLRHPAQLEAAEKILTAGVDPLWAKEWLRERAERSRAIPRSLAYFADACIEAWKREQDEAEARRVAAAFVRTPGVLAESPAVRPTTGGARFPNRETAGADTRAAATAAARRIAEQYDAAQGITRPAAPALPLLERAS